MVRLLAFIFALAAATCLFAGCGSDQVDQPNYGEPPDAAIFNPGNGNPGGGYGEGGSGSQTGDVVQPPMCAQADELCPETFTYPFNNETSVGLCGNYNPSAWTQCATMTHQGNVWTATVEVPYDQPVQYKFLVNGTMYVTDPNNPNTVMDAQGNVNSLAAAIECASPTCSEPPVPPPGVFDWRDAVIYFVFVDRFYRGNPSTNAACSVAGAMSTPSGRSSTNYLGGDWAGVTQQINNGYFTTLGVNVLWITVPVKNADNVVGEGTGFLDNNNTIPDTHEYSAYHGYWPYDPTQTEDCFGPASDLVALVQAAHAKNLKVLFDYAMVHVHTESPLYQQHMNDSPSWFTPECVCALNGCPNYDTTCWFAPYLAHYDYTNPAARNFSVNAAIQLIQNNGNDAFRLDAIKQVDPSWLSQLRPTIASQVLASESPEQRFYMVGETYDFQNRALIRSMINPATGLDGQFDFPLRARIVEAVLMRSTQNLLTPDDTNYSRNAPPGMTGLAQFMDSNDSFYPTDAVMSTFIGNHDLPRSIHYCEDPSLWPDSTSVWKDVGWGVNPNIADPPAVEADSNAYDRLANGFAVLFTNKGAPLVYYGDEVGLPGAGDPDNRRPMPWTALNADQQRLHDRIAALGQVRAGHPALRRGTRTELFTDEDLWVFSMATLAGDPAPDTVYVGINRSDMDRTSTNVPPGLPELLTNSTSSSTVTIPARQTRIWSQALADAGP